MATGGNIVLSRMGSGSKKRAAIKKRTNGLKKKVHDLSVLCDVEAAMVIYDPEKNQYTVYPKEMEKAKATILKYMSRNGTERLAQTETAKKHFEQKRQKKMAKAKRLNEKAENMSGEVILTKITDGELTFEEINSEQKKMVAKFLATLRAQVVGEIKKKEKEKNADGLNQAAPLLAGPADGGAQSDMISAAVVSWPYLPEQVEAMSATKLMQEALQDDALVPADARSNQEAFPSPVITLKNEERGNQTRTMNIAAGHVRDSAPMPPLPAFNNIAPLVPPISLGDTRNGNFRAMNCQPFPSLPRGPFWPQSHHLYNTSWMPQMQQSFPRPRNQMPLLFYQLQAASAQLPPLPLQLGPASTQLPPLPPQLGPASTLLPPQLELASQLPPLPQTGLMPFDFFPAPLRGQLVPLSPQLTPYPHQLEPRSLELFPQPSQLQIRGNTNVRLDAPTLQGFVPYHGAVNHTSKKN